MSRATAVDLDYLGWVKREIIHSLDSARQQLRDGGSSPAPGQLEAALTELRKVRGSLQIIELYGAALAAEEIEATAKALAGGGLQDNRAAIDGIIQAIEQLPAYLETLAGGSRDIPFALLPVLDTLRACRGETLISERLFNPDIGSVAPPAVERPATGTITLAQLAAKVTPIFRLNLLNSLRQLDEALHFQRLLDLVSKLAQVTHHAALGRLWWFTSAMLEAIIDKGLAADQNRLRLLGQVERIISTLPERSEEAAGDGLSPALLKSLLFQAAQAGSNGANVTALRQAYRLDGGEAGGGAQESDSTMMQEAAAAAQRSLEKVRKTLDKLAALGHGDADRLMSLADMLDQIADTLGILGLGLFRRAVAAQQLAVVQSALMGQAMEPERLQAISGALLYVENSLGQIEWESRAASSSDEEADRSLTEGELHQLQQAVIREIKTDLGAIKESISDFYQHTDEPARLAAIPKQLDRVRGGLVMMEANRAAELLESTGRYISHNLVTLGRHADEARLDDVAEVISAIEIAIEEMEGRRGARGRSLGAIEEAAARLQAEVERARQEQPQGAAEASASESGAGLEDVDEAERAEIIEIFIEEAEEQLAEIATLYPRWRDDHSDGAALTGLRKSFHTLKGSGRMAGATAFGDFAWAMEHFLNQIINEEYPVTPACFELLDQAVPLLPSLVEGFRTAGSRHRLSATQETLAQHAHTMSSSREAMARYPGAAAAIETATDSSQETSATISASAPEQPADGPVAENEPGGTITLSAATGRDPVLLTIFASETRQNLAVIEAFLADARAAHEPLTVSADLHKAVHTLYGSAAMADFPPIADIGEALEDLLTPMKARAESASARLIEVLTTAAAAIAASLERLDSPSFSIPGKEQLLREIRALESAPQEETAPGAMVQEEAETAPPAGLPPEAHALTDALPLEEGGADAVGALETFGLDTAAEAFLAEPPQLLPFPEPELESDPFEPLPLPEVSEDEEGLAIAREAFMEEGAEILALTEGGLARWMAAPDDLSLGLDMEKHLHTFKGGARMAGFPAQGNLSHAMESLLTAAVHEGRERSSAMFDLLQSALDALQEMFQQESRGVPAAAATALTERLLAMASGTETAAAGAEPSPPLAAPQIEQAETAPLAATTTPEIPQPPAAAQEREAETAATPPALEPLQPPPAPTAETGETAPAKAAGGAAEGETLRVSNERIGRLINLAAEASVSRARLEQNFSAFGGGLGELNRTVARLRDQIRKLEIETEAQILFRHEEASQQGQDFDPLEFDRFSLMQQLSRSLQESADDLLNIERHLGDIVQGSENILLQQRRTNSDLQEGLVRTRFEPFAKALPRLRRVVRQTLKETGKAAELTVAGAELELDSTIINRILPALEHMLRNAVDHGIEAPAIRAAAHKPESGTIALAFAQRGNEVVIELKDDGGGMNLEAIRRRAVEKGLIESDANPDAETLTRFVLEPGFSTAAAVTQISGRGVGMDVVNSEIKQLGGTLQMESTAGAGSRFTIRLPLTIITNYAVIVQIHDDQYAVPFSSVAGITQIDQKSLRNSDGSPLAEIGYGGASYSLLNLGELLGHPPQTYAAQQKVVPLLLVRTMQRNCALIVDRILGNREIVIKAVGPQLEKVPGMLGATIMADGHVVMVLDMPPLLQHGTSPADAASPAALDSARQSGRLLAMVVDDSITVRKVTARVLKRHEMEIMTAKDGIDALEQLQYQLPDVILLDIEMPRMDGFELASVIRNDARLKHIPIIMITSRIGDKHRERALGLGVNQYLGKPYNEEELITAIHALTGDGAKQQAQGGERWN